MSRLINGIKRLFFGIKGKLLLYMIVFMSLTLVIVLAVSSLMIDRTMNDLNDSIAALEMDHISSSLTEIFSASERAMSALMSYREVAYDLIRPENASASERTKRIKELSEDIYTHHTALSCMDSAYIVPQDCTAFGMARSNRRMFVQPEFVLSGNAEKIIGQLSLGRQYIGGLRFSDFPLYNRYSSEDYPLLVLCVKGLYHNTPMLYTVNLKESEICETFERLSREDLRQYFLIDSDGMVVSSINKEELGQKSALTDGLALDRAGSVQTGGRIIMWKPIGDTNLLLVSTTPTGAYKKDMFALVGVIAGTFLISLAAFTLFYYMRIRKELSPMDALIASMRRVGHGDYSGEIGTHGGNEIALMIQNYNLMLDRLQTLTEERENRETALRKSELRALRGQINPHFLYNTLNTMKCLADLDGNEKISECALTLGNMLVPLYKNASPVWTLREELDNVRNYLRIMNIRYSDRITTEFDIPEALLERDVMCFVLQPIVENSIEHGFSSRGYYGHVRLSGFEKDGCLYFSVEDDGVGMDAQEIARRNRQLKEGAATEGVGMMNVNMRITMRYGGEYGLTILPGAEHGLKVMIVLPADASE